MKLKASPQPLGDSYSAPVVAGKMSFVNENKCKSMYVNVFYLFYFHLLISLMSKLL